MATQPSDGYNFINIHQPETPDYRNQDLERCKQPGWQASGSVTVILLANGTENSPGRTA
ncbi:MAG: hypothetical protein ACLT4D_05830 [Blautia faecis]